MGKWAILSLSFLICKMRILRVSASQKSFIFSPSLKCEWELNKGKAVERAWSLMRTATCIIIVIIALPWSQFDSLPRGIQESQGLPGTARRPGMPGLGGGSPCCGELVLNLRASSTRGWGLTAKSSREDGRSPLGGGTGVSGASSFSCRLLPSAQWAVPILPPSEPPGAPQQREPPPQPAGPAQHFRCPERSEGRSGGETWGWAVEWDWGEPLPQHSRPPPWLCFPRLQPQEAPTVSWGPPIAFWDLLAVGCSSNPIGLFGQLLILASHPFTDEETEAQKG